MDVLKIVFDAPRSRVDNEISRLSMFARSLLLHCTARDRIVREYLGRRFRTSLQVTSLCQWIGSLT